MPFPEAEAELMVSEERFRTFAKKAPVAITIRRPDKQFEYVNPNFTEIFGDIIEDEPGKDAWVEIAYPEKECRDDIVSQCWTILWRILRLKRYS